MLHIAFCIKHSKSVNVTESKNVKLVDLYIRWTTTTTKIFAQKAAGNLTTNYLRTLAGSDNLRLITMRAMRNIDGRKVTLNKAALAEVNQAWDQWREFVFNPYIGGRNTRELYNEQNRRGQHLINIQTKHGIWLIHPVNATSGVRSDDPRIID